MTKEKICGIYKITNKIDGKYYIGSSKDIKRRWRSHILELNKNNHANSYLQRAWNKYGEHNFEFSIIETVSNINLLKEREQFWIDKLYPFEDKGYNLCKNTNAYSFGHIRSEEYKNKFRKPHSDIHKQHLRENHSKNREVLCFDLNGNIIIEAMSCRDMSRKFNEKFNENIQSSMIYGCCNKRYYVVHNHIFIYKDDYLQNKELLFNHINHKKNKTNKYVVRISLDFKDVIIFDSIVNASNSIDDNKDYTSSISACCKNKNITSGGYFWMYFENYELHKHDYIEYLAKLTNNFNKVRDCPIVQLDLDYNFIKIWESMDDIENNTELSQFGIYDCLRGKTHSSGGYRWIKICNYESGLYYKSQIKPKVRNKKIVQCDTNNNFIKTWKNPNDVQKTYDYLKSSSIRNTCQNKYKNHCYKGFNWYYKEDFDNLKKRCLI